jgi:molecular chaperone GrpE
MADSKKNRTSGQDPVENRPADETPSAELSPEACQELLNQLEESRAQAAEYLDGWQRTQAEFLNYKKRQEREQESAYQSMKGDIIRRILPALDDLERALQNRPEGAASDAWVAGVELIYRKLQSMLESEGVTRIQAEGQEFDPNFHEAISHEPHPQVASGHIIAVVQPGYLIGERVIRPAMVRVAQ